MTIKGFTTTKDVIGQLEKAGVEIKLPFQANGEFKCEKDPFSGKDVKGCDGKKINKVKKTKAYFATIKNTLKRKTKTAKKVTPKK